MGASSGLGNQIWVLVVNDSRPSGLEAENLEALLKIIDNIIEETIPLWRNGTKYWFLYANPSRYMSFASDTSCSLTSVMFPNFENVD